MMMGLWLSLELTSFSTRVSMRRPRFKPAGNNQGCSATDGSSDGLTSGSKSNHSFVEAVGVMRSNGYSFMASFLAVHLTEFSGSTRLTLLLQLTNRWTIMLGISTVTLSSGNNVLLNDVQVSFPYMYNSSWLVVHGVRRMLDTERNRTHSGSASKIGRKIEVRLLMMMMALLVFLF